jgi:hypothetical protein
MKWKGMKNKVGGEVHREAEARRSEGWQHEMEGNVYHKMAEKVMDKMEGKQ